MPSPLPPVSRRVLLGATAGVTVLGAAGCSSLDPTSDDPTLTPSGEPLGDRTTTGSADAPGSPAVDDEARVAEVLAALALTHRTVRTNARLHPEVARVLRPFEVLHRTHARELGDLPRTTGRVGDPTGSPSQALARVDRAEERLQRLLVDAATSAGSGALAQTLAAMAAAVAQLRTTLRTTPRTNP